SLYQIIKYQHSDGTYGTGGLNANNCPWGLNSFGNGQCQNWGNPFAEIYLQTLRYFADAGVTGDFRSNDSNDIPALNTPQVWDDPIKETNRCTSLNVVNFNSSSISYDGDDIDSHLGDINTTQTSAALTNPIGTGEGIDGNSYFVGDNGAGSNNQLCTAKTVTALGNVLGVCPEAPRLDGTYKVAGLAYYAHTHDINPNVTDIQKVDTYSVALSTSTPHIDITLPGTTRKVTILPACRDSTVGGNCSLVDFKIVKQDPAAGTGTFYVNWEDSEQGGDFDQDMWGMISYTATSSTVTVSTNVAAQSTPYAMGFGYVISGTTQDGFHAHSGINSFSYSDPTGAKDCNNCQSSNPATSQTYTVGSSSGALLHDPLWYASKWGAFLDSNNNKKPDIQHEWDRKTVDGADGSDGIPDTFFAVSNPKKLEDALRRVFNDILAKTASGTAAAVVANAREGVGAVYQALYEPTRKDKNENEVNWIGTLHALFVDDSGHLREDLNGNKQLDGYQTDPVVEIFFDTTDQKTKYKELASGSDSTFEPTGTETVKPLTDLKTLWNARKQLSAMTNTEVLNQRSYSDIATTGRYIFTWLDDNDDGVVDSGEVKPFVPSTFSGNNVGYLNAANTTEATNIVDYIRGEDISGYRNRTMDYDGDGTEETLRLGDIVHSTPTVAATPAEAFDLLYNDESYAAFRKKYQNRRNVVYVGANDGLLHAFNGGFYDAQDRTFSVNGSNGETADPLGSELWAYAPMDLLPHLKWLTEKDYPHVYYMDAKPRIFDAKIFPADSDHPNGWGTVLVAGMRLGGGPITVDTDNNGLGTGNDMTMRSAFVLLDVTNPEKPPSLIAEIKPPNLGFTTNYPTAMAMRDPQSGSPNEWYLLFGSGPTKLSDATSSQDARFYVYDLNTKSFVTNYDGYDLGVSNSFVGDPVSVDWDLDFLANAVYFGTIGGTPSNPTGKLFRFGVDEEAAPANWVPPKVLLDTGKPIMATPAVTVDKSKTPWVFVGTGRFFSQADKSSTAQQALYGVKDTNPPSNPTVATSDLVDVSNAVVTDTGTLSGVSGSSATTVTALDQDITDNHKGWFLNFPAQSFSNSAQRSITQSSLLGESLLATAFTPDPDVCGNEGRSELYGLYYRTGTPRGDNPIFGTVNNLAVRSVDLGVGMAASPSLAKGSGVDRQQVVVFTQTSTGAIVRQQAGVSTSASSGEMSWQQPRQQ
ncbi:MAG: PilC/PilY family type IV pilus protein, partial [Gammaproteobacteria bacterium]